MVKKLLVIFILAILVYTVVSAADIIVAQGVVIVDEVELQVDGVDVQCVYVYFESQRHGIGLSCDWGTPSPWEDATFTVLPTRTPVPPAYPVATPEPPPYPGGG